MILKFDFSPADPLPPYFNVDLPTNRNFSAGSEANLSCHASGIPRPAITWFKDGHRVPSSSVKELNGYSILAFDSIRLNDQGKYWCEANSTEGWNRSACTSLTGNYTSLQRYIVVTVCRLLLYDED